MKCGTVGFGPHLFVPQVNNGNADVCVASFALTIFA